MNKRFLFYLILVILGTSSRAQYSPKINGSEKSVLLSETRVDRPLIMHKNQLQFNAGYGFSVNLGGYDTDGDRIDFKKMGLAFSSNRFALSTHYGITEYFEFNTEIGYTGSLRRDMDVLIVGNDITQLTSLTEIKGIEDLRLGIGLKPWTAKTAFDLAIRFGAILPTAPFKDKKPEHVVKIDYVYNSTNIDYKFFKTSGKGMTFLFSGMDAKFKSNNAAFSLTLEGYRGLGSSTYTDWNSQRIDSSFTYFSSSFPIKQPNMLSAIFITDIKLFDWFDVYAGIRHTRYFNGWKEIGTLKYAIPESSLSLLTLGFEILTTVHLRILEHAELSLGGKNADAYTGIVTTLSYNLFTQK